MGTRGSENPLLGVERVGLRAKAAGGGAVVEVAAQGGGHEGVEDDLGTPEALSVAAQNPGRGAREETQTYLKAGRDSHRRKTNLKV